jgi:hypothetical protein
MVTDEQRLEQLLKSQPTSGRDLLSNYAVAVRKDLFFRADIYTDSNIDRYFNGRMVRRSMTVPSTDGYQSTQTTFTFSVAPLPSPAIGSASFDTLVRKDAVQSLFAWIEVRGGPGIQYQDIVEAFQLRESGNDQKVDAVPPHPLELPAPTSPHGNEIIRRDISDNRTLRTLSFRFSSDGSLERLRIELERK